VEAEVKWSELITVVGNEIEFIGGNCDRINKDLKGGTFDKTS
jgi:hypothetical protein